MSIGIAVLLMKQRLIVSRTASDFIVVTSIVQIDQRFIIDNLITNWKIPNRFLPNRLPLSVLTIFFDKLQSFRHNFALTGISAIAGAKGREQPSVLQFALSKPRLMGSTYASGST